MNNLEPHYQARNTTRAKLESARQALDRAQRIEAAATMHVHALEERLAQAEAAQAAQLADAIAAGGPSADFPSAIDDGLASALVSARSDLSIKSKALGSLKRAHAKAQADLAAAERTVVAAVDQIFRDEDITSARQVAHHLDETIRLGKALLHLSIAEEVNGRHPPSEVTEVLARLDLPLIDRHHVAINLMKDGDVLGAAKRSARRAALIAGEYPECNERFATK
jgi:hypothetical protein